MNESDRSSIVTKLREGFDSFVQKGADRAMIEKVCECQANYLPRFPVNVVEIAEKLDLEVYEAFLSEGISGMLELPEHRIYIEKTDSPQRRRFTCAHEVGHFILHGPKNHDVTLLRSSSTDAMEKDADSLAAEILMPIHFVKKFLESDMSAEDFAKKFNVSKVAAEFRMRVH